MLFRRPIPDNPYGKLAERIREDLIATLKKKGVNITVSQINVKPNTLNISVCIKEK